MITWSDELGSRGRRPWLLLIKCGVVHRFRGETIPGVVAVLGGDYVKNGKWSHTTYRLEVAPGVRAIAGREGWRNGTFREGLAAAVGAASPLDRWAAVSNALGVALSECRRFLGEEFPRDAAALDRVEADLGAIDDECEWGAEEIAISFGAPSRRQMAAGFWSWPVRIFDSAGEEVGRVAPAEGADGWWKPAVTGGMVRLLACERSDGIHGGYVSLRLAVPSGCRAEHGQPE